MEMLGLIKFIREFDDIKLEEIILKHLIENGIDSSDKLRTLLNQAGEANRTNRWGLENSMKDYERGILNLKKIPSVK